jgi:hypothetical protein
MAGLEGALLVTGFAEAEDNETLRAPIHGREQGIEDLDMP